PLSEFVEALLDVLERRTLRIEENRRGGGEHPLLFLQLRSGGAADRVLGAMPVEQIEDLLGRAVVKRLEDANLDAGMILKESAHQVVCIADSPGLLAVIGEQEPGGLDSSDGQHEDPGADSG